MCLANFKVCEQCSVEFLQKYKLFQVCACILYLLVRPFYHTVKGQPKAFNQHILCLLGKYMVCAVPTEWVSVCSILYMY